ncbi:MAG: DNA-directed RNA polymerase subunit omega [Planctomycetes bacterium]|nr:DNA-directed RNA polymerase subunit omega [Planctomycetota bacterium]
MLDELKEEGIVNKVGGRFKLSTLIQKRMVALNTGAKALVEMRGADKMAIVIQEILQDKIYLDASGNLQAKNHKAKNQTIMANLPGAYPGMPGAAPPMPSTGVRADSDD